MISLASDRNFYRRYGLNRGLPDGCEAPEAGAREDAGVPEQRAEQAACAAAHGQPARKRRADDAVQHLMPLALNIDGNQELWPGRGPWSVL